MKYKYIELSCSYAGSTYFYIIKVTICVLSNSHIKYHVILIFIYRKLLWYRRTLEQEWRLGVRTPFWLCSDVKLGRIWKELQSARCTTSLSHCSSYVCRTSTAILIAWYRLTYFDALASNSALSGLYCSRRGIHEVWGRVGMGVWSPFFMLWREKMARLESTSVVKLHGFSISLQQLHPA
jgi:hypothetical protein